MSSANGHYKDFRVGNKVRIKTAKHPDVMAGTVGEIDCHHQGGYGVKIDGHWMVAGNDRGMTERSVRIVWYEPHEIEAV